MSSRLPSALLASCIILVVAGCDEIERISQSGHGAYEASMTRLRDGFAVAWYDDRDGNPEIYLRLLDINGKARSPEYRITNDLDSSYEADVQAVRNDLAVGWYERTTNGELRARFGMWTQAGELVWTRLLSPVGQTGRNTLVRLSGNDLFTAWIEDVGETAQVWAQWWGLKGEPLTQPDLLAPASRNTWNLNATVDDDGRVWLAFDAHEGTRTNEIFLLRVTRTESNLARLTEDDGFASKYPDLALRGSRAALTWFDERDGNREVYLFAGGRAELREGMERQSRRITNTAGESIGAYVSAGADGFGLAWCDNTPGQHEIYFQFFDTLGRPMQDARQITNTPMESLIPAILSLDTGFALAWNEYKPHGIGSHARGGRSEVAFSIVQRRNSDAYR